MIRGKRLPLLDDVAWEDLEHAHGSAEDVPLHIEALASPSPEARGKAHRWISAALHHEGTSCSAGAPAVPFLVELARDAGTPDRAWIVRFLADLAVGRPNEWTWAGFDLRDPVVTELFDAAGAAPARAAYEAVEAGLDALLALLADRDAAVRAAAAFTVSFFARRTSDIRGAARAALAREEDPRAAASLLLCLAIHDGYAKDRASQPLMLPRLDADGPLALAAATALSFGEAPGVGADRRALPVFARALAAAPAPARWDGFPWNDGDLAALAIAHLGKQIPAAEAGRRARAGADVVVDEVTAIHFAIVERVHDDSPPRDLALAEVAVRPLLTAVTVERPPPAGWTLATLPPRLRRFADAIAHRPTLASARLFDALAENGLPGDLEPLRAFLGVRVEGPLDTPVAIDGETRCVRAWPRDERLAGAVAKLPNAIDVAVALANEPIAAAIVDAAVALDPARAHDAALALAERFARRGPPVVYGRARSAFPRAMTLVARAAARVAETSGAVPEPTFDAMIEAELGAASAWGDIERYFRALPQERVEAVLLGLASRGWTRSYPDRSPITVDAPLVDRLLVLLEPPRRERLVVAIAERGDFRAIVENVAKYATPAIVEALLVRSAASLAEMKSSARSDVDEARERDAGALAAAGLAAFGTVRRVRDRAGAAPELVELSDAVLEAIDAESAVGSAMRDARIDDRDDRGLVPLAEARRVVEATRVFRKGEGKMKDGTFVHESDRVWAALLSLDSAEELVRHAKRIAWEFHVRGRDNLALFERWGAAILPFVESRIDERGHLANVPWCIVPCLLAMDGKDALAVALKVDAVHELLPGHAPLGGGAGAFVAGNDDADDDDADDDDTDGDDDDDDDDDDGTIGGDGAPSTPRAFVTSTRGLDLARRWVARHPQGYAMLAELADEGDARAAELLRERAKALGGVVREAIEATLGRDRSGSIAKKLGLPRSSLAPEIEAVLAEAEAIDEPRGPLWTIAELDDAAREHDLPTWDDARYTVGAMRVTGFASRHGDALVIETISTSPSAGDFVRWEARAFGPGVRERQFGELLADRDTDELGRIELDGPDYVDGVTGAIHLWGKRNELGKPMKESRGATVVPQAMPPENVAVDVKRAALGVRGAEKHVKCKLPRTFAGLADVRRITPDEALLVQLCKHHADAMFAQDRGLSDRLGLPDGAVKLFAFDDFEHVAAGAPASASKDLVLMAEALRRRRKITRLVGRANTRPELWMPAVAELRSYSGADAWAPEDDPIEPAYPEDPSPFASPYDAWLVGARGWPHGIALEHAPAANAVGQAEQTVAELLGGVAPAMHGRWPRRTACVWARVAAHADAWKPDDKAARKAMRNDAMLYAPEARKLVARFAARAWSPPAFVGSELAWIVEALAGPRAALDAFADALDARSPAAFAKDHPALAAAVFELGFVLRRAAPEDRAACTKRLEARWAKATEARGAAASDVVRALDLVLHGRKGAERSARAEGDYVLVDDDRAWAGARLLDAATAPSPPDALALAFAGEAMLDKWAARWSADADAARFAVQLGKVGGARAMELLLRVFEERPEAQATVASVVVGRPGAKDALAAAMRGPHERAARALLEAVLRKEEELATKRAGHEGDEGEEESDEDDGGDAYDAADDDIGDDDDDDLDD